jgi:hypothetical protein
VLIAASGPLHKILQWWSDDMSTSLDGSASELLSVWYFLILIQLKEVDFEACTHSIIATKTTKYTLKTTITLCFLDDGAAINNNL